MKILSILKTIKRKINLRFGIAKKQITKKEMEDLIRAELEKQQRPGGLLN